MEASSIHGYSSRHGIPFADKCKYPLGSFLVTEEVKDWMTHHAYNSLLNSPRGTRGPKHDVKPRRRGTRLFFPECVVKGSCFWSGLEAGPLFASCCLSRRSRRDSCRMQPTHARKKWPSRRTTFRMDGMRSRVFFFCHVRLKALIGHRSQ